jgi:hypothetical protein
MGLFSRASDLTPEERRLKLQTEHAERMKALEMGRPLPEVEVAQARAEEVRAQQETTRAVNRAVFMALGPAGVVGITVGATSIILSLANPAVHVILLSVVWVCSALVSLGMIASTVILARRVNLRDLIPPPKPAAPPQPRPASTPVPNEPVDIEGPLSADEVDRLARAFQK